MHKIFQTNFNSGAHESPGNCWQAQVASLLDLQLDEVPHFITYGDKSHETFYSFLREKGWVYDRYISNPRRLGGDGVFKDATELITSLTGVNGFFSACVFSPNYFTAEKMCDWDAIQPIHAVIIDKEFNVVHDPNPIYSEVKEYPLSRILGWNGIIGYDVITKM